MNSKTHAYFFALPVALAFLLYINTVSHSYTLDDHAVISAHTHVQKGVQGIPQILTSNFLQGTGVNDGLYRPLPLISFALEKSLFNNKPFFGHLLNVLLYALTGALVFILLRNIFFAHAPFIALTVAILFVTHPVHTEVVAGIKGRDDILALLFLLLTAIFLFKGAVESKHVLTAVALLFFLLALCSKEISVAAVAALPLMLWTSKKVSAKKCRNLLLTADGSCRSMVCMARPCHSLDACAC